MTEPLLEVMTETLSCTWWTDISSQFLATDVTPSLFIFTIQKVLMMLALSRASMMNWCWTVPMLAATFIACMAEKQDVIFRNDGADTNVSWLVGFPQFNMPFPDWLSCLTLQEV